MNDASENRARLCTKKLLPFKMWLINAGVKLCRNTVRYTRSSRLEPNPICINFRQNQLLFSFISSVIVIRFVFVSVLHYPIDRVCLYFSMCQGDADSVRRKPGERNICDGRRKGPATWRDSRESFVPTRDRERPHDRSRARLA